MLVASLAALALGTTASPAAAKPSCARQIIADWVDDNNIDGTYPLHCYPEAITAVPEDLAVYTNVVEDIMAARQRASRVRRLSGNPNSNTTKRTASTPTRPVFKQAFDKLGSRNVDTVPLPLLILAALSLLLVAAGAAGLVARRMRSARGHTPPAA